MKERVLITGANGMVAKKLGTYMQCLGYDVIFLSTKKNNKAPNVYFWNPENKEIDLESLNNVKHIVHLAGFSISNTWTKRNKSKMYKSRVESCKFLFELFDKNKLKIDTFITASASGYYGFNQNSSKTETDKPGTDWLAKICIDWEKQASKFSKLGARVVKMRIPIILEKGAEILNKIILGLSFGQGIIFGNGRQSFPWIHIDDLVNFICFSIKNNNIKGAYNISSPENCSNYEFVETIRNLKFSYAILIKIPEFLIKILFYKKYVLLLNNLSLNTDKLRDTGFKWRFKSSKLAMKDILEL